MFVLLHIDGRNWRVNVQNISHYYEKNDGKVVVHSMTGAQWIIDEDVNTLDKLLNTLKD
ncbi:hypothetical protein [Paenibacillus spiritus]|uniref:hypothetical protein n=1 Tax=Paenibacillus spiritus TaxID=2496557 RepID=UPI00168B7382|nr:hypothetical protein [Paenibacillus spiritus]